MGNGQSTVANSAQDSNLPQSIEKGSNISSQTNEPADYPVAKLD